MAIRKTDNSPGRLAAELQAHRERWEKGRASVIERGVTRVSQIAELQKELAAEVAEHKKVLADAQ